MTRFDTWESYFYPETYNSLTGRGTLRNLFGERDEGVLRALEYGSTRDRQVRGDLLVRHAVGH